MLASVIETVMQVSRFLDSLSGKFFLDAYLSESQ
jgi:hypothetical protein